jgi:hypothetical protein
MTYKQLRFYCKYPDGIWKTDHLIKLMRGHSCVFLITITMLIPPRVIDAGIHPSAWSQQGLRPIMIEWSAYNVWLSRAVEIAVDVSCEKLFSGRQFPRYACIASGHVDGEDIRQETCSDCQNQHQ